MGNISHTDKNEHFHQTKTKFHVKPDVEESYYRLGSTGKGRRNNIPTLTQSALKLLDLIHRGTIQRRRTMKCQSQLSRQESELEHGTCICPTVHEAAEPGMIQQTNP